MDLWERLHKELAASQLARQQTHMENQALRRYLRRTVDTNAELTLLLVSAAIGEKIEWERVKELRTQLHSIMNVPINPQET